MKPNQTWPITKTNRRKELFQVRIQPTLRNQVREISHLTGQSLSSIAEEAFLDFIQKNRTGLRDQMSVKQESWTALLGRQS
ncbi:hypothetical protein CMK14_14280 [Candidatus Poribacteria bacterium]|nr:hypothetical protein [Candidatus Poribacteria bacterium]